MNFYIRKLIGFFEITAIVLFIIFEKSIWTFAMKTFKFIKSLAVFEALNNKLNVLDKYVILLVFCGIFLLSKTLSFIAVYLLGSGEIVWGIVAYMSTFPVGAMSIWLLEMQKDKLNEFPWFMWCYTKVEYLIAKLKDSAPYKRVKILTAEYKEWIEVKKAKMLHIKNNRKDYSVKLMKRYKALSRLWRMRFERKKKSYTERRKKNG